jgi:Ca-activated chloride channel family protein
MLGLMVDSIKDVKERVELWKKFGSTPGIGDVIYGMILGRIRTAAEMASLHKALGIRTIDETTKRKMLDGANTPAERAQRLRKLASEWKDDLVLQLELMEALEDAGDDIGAWDLARTLRRRPDCDAHARTVIGEYYFRLARKKNDAALTNEALRCIGEIVEFSPDDPVVRRRLGDLLRAHGYFAEAGRHYESLERLAPDDPSIALLRAAASQGIGKLEESVRWTEKAMTSVAPSGEASLATTARAFALSYLAWERLAAHKANDPDKVQKLLRRSQRIINSSGLPGGIRVALTWSHPDIHPVLWSSMANDNTLSPATDGDENLGIGQTRLGTGGGIVEVRLEKEEARIAKRYGISLLLSVISGEGTDKEKLQMIPLAVNGEGDWTARYRVDESGVERL